MTYLEKMKEATNDFERSKVVEGYTNEFAAIMSAAGLEPAVGILPTANGQVWVPYTNIPAKDLIDFIAAISTADQELGDRASELHGDILNCANFSVALEAGSEPRTPPTAEDVAEALKPDPDADSYVWLSPVPIDDDGLVLVATAVTPLTDLHKGRILQPVTPALVADPEDDEDLPIANPMIVTLLHRDEDDGIVAFNGYEIEPLKAFRRRTKLEPSTPEEVAEREYNEKYGYFHHARVKLSRTVYVLTRYVSYGCAAYLEENHPAWKEAEAEAHEEEIEPTTSTIELDEGESVMPSLEEQHEAVDENIKEYLRLGGHADELERKCRMLFALKQEKKDTDADFNEQIKGLEDDIRAFLRRRETDRIQHRLPLEGGVPDAEAEKALDAAAEESQETPPEGPEPAPSDPAPASPDDTEPEEEPATGEPAGFVAPEPEPPAHDFPQCPACEGRPGPDGCEHCNDEGIEPAVRESDDDGMLLCARCGQPRSFWAFLKYDDGRKGHVCNVCRKV